MKRFLLGGGLVGLVCVAACSSGKSSDEGRDSTEVRGTGGIEAIVGTGGTPPNLDLSLGGSADVTNQPATGGRTAPMGGSAGIDGQAVFDVGRDEFCQGDGVIPIPGEEMCTGDIAKKVFRFAICSCSDFTPQQIVNTESMDASQPGVSLDGGSVGVNGNYLTTAPTDIQGAMYIGGSYNTSNAHNVEQTLWCQDTAYVGAPATVGGDAYIGGVVTSGTPQNLDVAGTLYSPESGNVSEVAAKSYEIEAVDVPQPCDCENPVDIASIVSAFKTTNDNDDLLIFPDTFTKDPNVVKDITLECGRYFLDGIVVNNPATIRVKGRAVLAIEGNINMSGELRILLDPGAELDLFVTGNVFLNNAATIGDSDSPKSTRIYVGGNDVTMTGQFDLSANFYLPNAAFNVTSTLNMSGAIFAKEVASTGAVSVRYDEGIVSLDGCIPPDVECTSCSDCVNPYPACGDGGQCGPCGTDDDCCPPLVCDGSGQCVPPKTIVK